MAGPTASAFCEDCPDHEACAGAYPCATVKKSAAIDAMRRFRETMVDVGDAAMVAAAVLAAVPVPSKPVPTVTTRPKVGGMQGDIVQSVGTTVPMNSDRAVVQRVVDEAEKIIREHARVYGYTLIGGIDARTRVNNDGPVTEIEVIVEGRLRERRDGVWGEIREAIEQDKVDLQIAKRSPLGVVGATFASGGYIGGASGWSTRESTFEPGTMKIDSASGEISTYNGSNWIVVGTSTLK